MDYLTRPVAYLDTNDFDNDGNLINPLIPSDKPVFIMFQANFCGYCKLAKPAFQEFAEKNKDKFFVATIQADSQIPEVQQLKEKSQKIYPNLIGFPSYLLYFKGKRIIYNGGRTLQDLQSFADGFFNYFKSISTTPSTTTVAPSSTTAVPSTTTVAPSSTTTIAPSSTTTVAPSL